MYECMALHSNGNEQLRNLHQHAQKGDTQWNRQCGKDGKGNRKAMLDNYNSIRVEWLTH